MSDAWEFFDGSFMDLLAISSSLSKDPFMCAILRKIYSFVREEIKKYKNQAKYAKPHIQYQYERDSNKIDICRSNILKIQNLLQETNETRDEFIKIFPSWEKTRKKNVDKLNKIAQILHDERKIINTVKVIGSCVGVAGGNFWFVSDFHVDQNYSREGNPEKLCHEDGTVHPDAGLYGNFLCDSPLTLINATIEAMKSIQPHPDFIVWTGDSLPHTDPLGYDPDWDVIFQAINNITELLHSSFPNTPIYPSIGNHDTFPPNILLPDGISDTVYDGYLQKGGWKKLLSKNASVSFHQGGFYTEIIKPGLRLISLNTILWYFPNKHTAEIEDPANQLSWLRKVLNASLMQSEKVYIIGHVSPGFNSRGAPGQKSDPLYHDHFLIKCLDILHQYSDIIIGQMYGHFHLDFFQLFQFNTGSFKSSSVLASSVTPWHSIDEFDTLIPVNPSIKLMHYSEIDFSLLDYELFYMNLSRVNSMKDTFQGPRLLYEPLYQFTTFYGVPNLSTNSLVQVYENLKRDEKLFQEFFLLLTSGKKSVDCGKDCKIAQLCAMSGTSGEEYDQCMNTVDESSTYKSTHSLKVKTNILIAALVTFLILCLFVPLLLYVKCCKRSKEVSFSGVSEVDYRSRLIKNSKIC